MQACAQCRRRFSGGVNVQTRHPPSHQLDEKNINVLRKLSYQVQNIAYQMTQVFLKLQFLMVKFFLEALKIEIQFWNPSLRPILRIGLFSWKAFLLYFFGKSNMWHRLQKGGIIQNNKFLVSDWSLCKISRRIQLKYRQFDYSTLKISFTRG